MPALTVIALLLAAQGPSDTTPSGPVIGSLPTKDVPMGAGVALPGTKADVTSGPGRYGIGQAKPELAPQAEQRKIDAVELADKVRRGAVVPTDYARRLRDAIDGDLTLWREQFGVSRDDYKAMRKEWLAEKPERTASEWAVRRADWFAARDAWIASRK
jgi:hypothetical protein